MEFYSIKVRQSFLTDFDQSFLWPFYTIKVRVKNSDQVFLYKKTYFDSVNGA